MTYAHSYNSIPNAFAELDVSLSRSLPQLNMLLKYMRLADAAANHVVSQLRTFGALFYADAMDDFRVRRWGGEGGGGALSREELQKTKSGACV